MSDRPERTRPFHLTANVFQSLVRTLGQALQIRLHFRVVDRQLLTLGDFLDQELALDTGDGLLTELLPDLLSDLQRGVAALLWT
jgi:hypothetical protein